MWQHGFKKTIVNVTFELKDVKITISKVDKENRNAKKRRIFVKKFKCFHSTYIPTHSLNNYNQTLGENVIDTCLVRSST